MMVRVNVFRTLVVIACLARAVAGAPAQTNTGEIQGVVKDPSGAVLPGAAVTVLQLSTGVTVERRTDERGLYFIGALPIGEYTLRVGLDGFRTVTRSGLTLQVGQRLDVPIVLP